MRLGGTKSALREEDYILLQKRKRKSSIGNRIFCTPQNSINIQEGGVFLTIGYHI